MQRDEEGNKSAALSAFAIVGLGRMGGNVARQALAKGLHVVSIDARPVPVLIVVRHTGLDSRQEALALLGTVAFPSV